MDKTIISVAHFTKDETIKNAVLKSDEIRQKTLKHCYSIVGYESLPLSEKNKIYDTVKALYINWFYIMLEVITDWQVMTFIDNIKAINII